MRNQNTARMKLGLITLTGIFMALIVVAIVYIMHIPFGNSGGYVHLGDAVIYLAAAILPAPYAIVAAAVGGAMADILSGAAVWAFSTAIIKGLMVLPFTSKSSKILCARNLTAVVISGIVLVAGYYLAEAVLVGNFISPLASMWMNGIQAIANGVAFCLLGFALDKINLKNRIGKSL